MSEQTRAAAQTVANAEVYYLEAASAQNASVMQRAAIIYAAMSEGRHTELVDPAFEAELAHRQQVLASARQAYIQSIGVPAIIETPTA